MADRYINSESVYQFAKELCKEKETGAYAKGYNNALHAIMSAARSEALPTAEVRPVVFCKDCKYFHKESGKCLNIDGMAKQLDSTDFCSCGIRREVDDADGR